MGLVRQYYSIRFLFSDILSNVMNLSFFLRGGLAMPVKIIVCDNSCRNCLIKHMLWCLGHEKAAEIKRYCHERLKPMIVKRVRNEDGK
jgi:hypothetical protein